MAAPEATQHQKETTSWRFPLKRYRVGAYVVRQHLRPQALPAGADARAAVPLQLACAGCGKIDYPDAILNKRLSVKVPRRGRRVRRADGRHSGRRAADPQRDRRNRQGHRGAQEIRLAVHQRAAVGKKAAPVRAVALFVLLGPSRRAQAPSRQIGLHGRRLERAVAAIKAAKDKGFAVNVNCTIFDGHPAEDIAGFLDLTEQLGVGVSISPGYAYERAPDQQHFLTAATPRNCSARSSLGQGQEMEFHPLGHVPRLPRRQPGISLHAVGHADPQHLRLAEAVLSARRRLCQDFQ